MTKMLSFMVAAAVLLGAVYWVYEAKPQCRDGYVPVMSAHYQWYCAAGYTP